MPGAPWPVRRICWPSRTPLGIVTFSVRSLTATWPGASEADVTAQLLAFVAATSDLVLLCVTGTPEVEATIYGENGLLGAVRKGLIIADCSTAVPQSSAPVAANTAVPVREIRAPNATFRGRFATNPAKINAMPARISGLVKYRPLKGVGPLTTTR